MSTDLGTVTVVIDPTKPYDLEDFYKRKTKAQEEGWRIVTDVSYRAGRAILELVQFTEPGEDSVSGPVLLDRTKRLGAANAGERHAQALVENSELIPKSWDDFYLLFAGVEWQDKNGTRAIPWVRIKMDETRGHEILLRGLDIHQFHSHDRLVRVRAW